MSARNIDIDQNVDDLTYNPKGDYVADSAAYNPNDDPEDVPVAARGAGNQPSYVNAGKEDQEAARSEATGRVSKGEVQELMQDTTKDEKKKSGTRGKKINAYKQEQDMDRAFEETGTDPAEQDVEIRAAVGRR
ncbi:hypothetical protein SERLADRAFT_468422 [Serpula lacrymans var. lacrymans S7.9]|uniref:Uncharacterized protein n=1 Tax=Serpula lacrymans var. lacrymans (strain S7.9) TaxID=578457 RepID=F8NXP5_SERL9|nr:uncharacterized protein SERLADRAFT_468422 [Serpula lacrymans var. lacrymans S7.9]EGO24717.1 hypothetical protein SERLADRAFT_468422 [Serpula lacrymans var. lacrymans S7.9]